jgi:hypothetical protein
VRTKINREDACSTVQDEHSSSSSESHFDKLLVRAWRAARRAAAAAARAWQDALLPLLSDQQGGSLALDGNGEMRRGLNRGDQSPSFGFREQPPM